MKTSARDSLTGAYSRAAFDDRFPVEFQRAFDSEAPLSLLIIDLDHFKSVNDAFGHPRGDEVLIEFVRRVVVATRGSDLLYRYGGDEFVQLLPKTSKIDAIALAQRLQETVQAAPFPGEPPLSLSLSIGVACNVEAEDATSLFEKADLRLLEAKRRGRAQVVAKEPITSPLPAFQASSRLVERELEVEAIYRFLAALSERSRGLFEILGSPGSGKSRFLGEVVKAAQLQGYQAISLQATPALKVRSFGALLEAADSASGLPRSPSEIDAFIHSLPEWLKARGRSGLLFAVDDLPDLDPATVSRLHDLLVSSNDTNLALAFTSDPRRAVQGLPLEAPAHERVELFPLSLEGLRIWLRNLLQWEPDQDFLAWLFKETEGYPARFNKGVAYLIDQGALKETVEGWSLQGSYNAIPLTVWLNAQAAPPPNNLPVLTPIVGRESEISHTKALLERNRHVTLIGPGGIGKSRLATQVAAERLQAYRHGAFLIHLGPLSSSSFIVPAIAEALMFFFYGQEDPKAQLLNYLREKEMLLVLDNFEHLIDGASLITEILHAAPGVSILVTSRERLNLQLEATLELRGLPVPESSTTGFAEDNSAMQLFLQSARKEQAVFSPSEGDKPHIVRILQLVEGMPLGIELAAAWVKMLPPREIAEQIEHNLDFLTTSRPAVPKRHRSLHAVFDHFWGYLSEPERSVLCAMSVLRGGFRREAVEQIAGASFFLLSALVDKSFLHRNASGRYEMHEVLRQYAEEKLGERHDERQSAHDRHCEYFARFLHQRETQLESSKQRQALNEISEEIENIRTSWRWAVRQGKAEAIRLSLESLFRFYEMRNWFQEGEEAFKMVADRLREPQGFPDLDAAARSLLLGRVLSRQGRLAFRLSLNEKAKAFLEDSLALLSPDDEPQEIAFALNNLGDVARLLGEYEQAKGYHHQALALYQTAGNRYGMAISLNHLGVIAGSSGTNEDAEALFQESLAICREIGEQWGAANALNNLGVIAQLLGKNREAKQLYQESLEISREINDRMRTANAYHNLGRVAHELGEFEEAKRLSQESLIIFREIGDLYSIAITLTLLGNVSFELGDYDASRLQLYEALKTGLALSTPLIVLDSLIGVAKLLSIDEEMDLVFDILHLVLHHPAGDQETKNRAERLLEELSSQCPPQTLADAAERAEGGISLATLIERVLSTGPEAPARTSRPPEADLANASSSQPEHQAFA